MVTPEQWAEIAEALAQRIKGENKFDKFYQRIRSSEAAKKVTLEQELKVEQELDGPVTQLEALLAQQSPETLMEIISALVRNFGDVSTHFGKERLSALTEDLKDTR